MTKRKSHEYGEIAGMWFIVGVMFTLGMYVVNILAFFVNKLFR